MRVFVHFSSHLEETLYNSKCHQTTLSVPVRYGMKERGTRGRLELTLLRKRKSSRLGQVSGLSRAAEGSKRNGPSLFTYVHHLPLSPSTFTTVFPPSLLPCSPPLFPSLSRSPPFVSVMFSNGSGVRHDTKRHDRECSLLPRVFALQGIAKWSFPLIQPLT